jgi:pimeloyl-ACP methyl ester carboxylesterase
MGDALTQTFVLVHPAWFGGWCWRKVTPFLRARGHAVHTPTLTGFGERAHQATPHVGLATNIDDIVNVLFYEDLDRVVLVGNSSAGAVITGVADRVRERIDRLVYLDAFVPRNGQSVVDLVPSDRRRAMEALVQTEGDGWLLPRFAATQWEQFIPAAWEVTDESDLSWVLARLCPAPFGHFTEPVRLGLSDADMPPRVYVRSRWPHPGFDGFAKHAQSSSEWTYVACDSSHLPQITDPERLVGVLLEHAGPSRGGRNVADR